VSALERRLGHACRTSARPILEIAVGFGGTLNLVTACVLLAVIGSMAAAFLAGDAPRRAALVDLAGLSLGC